MVEVETIAGSNVNMRFYSKQCIFVLLIRIPMKPVLTCPAVFESSCQRARVLLLAPQPVEFTGIIASTEQLASYLSENVHRKYPETYNSEGCVIRII